MNDLFRAAASRAPKPLAAEVRPTRLEDIVGQRHILGPKGVLRRRIASGALGSIILYGPPGVGKTTIARAIGIALGKSFEQLHPAHNNVADIKKVAEEARVRSTLLFVDEVHRFNAAQQDYFLSLCEDGVFDFIGATTGNPYHVLTPALVSRSTILRLEPIEVDDMKKLLRRTIAHLTRGGTRVSISDSALSMLAGRASGDARRALNALEGMVAGAPGDELIEIDDAMVDDVFQASPIPYDRSGDAHYDVISAFIKSMRGSDPDATLYWLARLIHGGEDPRYIARRLMIHASEDVGLADNTALQTAVAAAEAVEKIGYPEAQIVLAHAALHIARAPKSNSACRGISLALEHVRRERAIAVPPHLRDGHYKGAEALGVKGYVFPHDLPAGWTPQVYAPGISSGEFYVSDARENPTFERRADEYWKDIQDRNQPRRFRGGS